MKKGAASTLCLLSISRDESEMQLENTGMKHSKSFSTLFDSLEDLEETALFLPNGTDKLYLPRNDISTCSLDEYLGSIPIIAERSQKMALHNHAISERAESEDYSSHEEDHDDECLFWDMEEDQEVPLQDKPSFSGYSLLHKELEENKRWLNVMQGEVAHATPSQADILASTDATTCHIVALHSTCENDGEPLTSVTHIDRKAYRQCLEEMVVYHIQHFAGTPVLLRENRNIVCDDFWGFEDDSANDHSFLPLTHRDSMPSVAGTECSFAKIDMHLHLVGGFLDSEGTSQELSTHLVSVFSEIANKYQDSIKMTICTALISSMNTCSSQSNFDSRRQVAAPKARGLGVDTRTGKVFLVNDPLREGHQGPVPEVRAARLLFDTSDTLQVIHEADHELSVLKIQPFEFRPLQGAESLLSLPDSALLKLTSTSPECEHASHFCSTLRRTLSFVQTSTSETVFSRKPLVFTRCCKTSQNIDQFDWVSSL